MTKDDNSKKIRKAYADLERHRPVRSAWANRFMGGKGVSRLLAAKNLTLLVLPFTIIGVLLILSYGADPGTPQLSMAAAWWISSVLVGAPAVFCLGAFVVYSYAFKRSPLGMSVSEMSTLLAYVPSCPRLAKAVRRWAVESGDGGLSGYEYHLIYRVSSAMTLNRSGNPVRSTVPLDLNDDFYEVFPAAPRFSEEQEGLFGEKPSYAKHVELLDSIVGHIGVAQARCRAQALEQRIPSSSKAGTQARARF